MLVLAPIAADTRHYLVSKAQMKCLDIAGDEFHPEWTQSGRGRRKRGGYCRGCPNP
jgi:hypothetical protein